MKNTSKIRVIVIDDDHDILDMVTIFLQSMGCDVVGTACDGQAGYDVFKAQQPDLTLLDIKMPVMNGLETLKKIHHDQEDSPIFMLTSVDDTTIAEHCCHAGAKGWLRKDMDPEGLKMRLQDVVNEVCP